MKIPRNVLRNRLKVCYLDTDYMVLRSPEIIQCVQHILYNILIKCLENRRMSQIGKPFELSTTYCTNRHEGFLSHAIETFLCKFIEKKMKYKHENRLQLEKIIISTIAYIAYTIIHTSMIPSFCITFEEKSWLVEHRHTKRTCINSSSQQRMLPIFILTEKSEPTSSVDEKEDL